MSLGDVYRKNNMKLPHRLQTMESGKLPPAPLPPRIPYAEVRKEDIGRYCNSLVNSQQMLLDNIRHLKEEVDKTNREIKKSRKERLYGNLLEDEIKQERELPHNSRFFISKGTFIQSDTTTISHRF